MWKGFRAAQLNQRLSIYMPTSTAGNWYGSRHQTDKGQNQTPRSDSQAIYVYAQAIPKINHLHRDGWSSQSSSFHLAVYIKRHFCLINDTSLLHHSSWFRPTSSTFANLFFLRTEPGPASNGSTRWFCHSGKVNFLSNGLAPTDRSGNRFMLGFSVQLEV